MIGGPTLAVAETRETELARLGDMFPLADRDTDAFALLERFAPDGIVIATPAAAHAPLAIAGARTRCAGAGRETGSAGYGNHAVVSAAWRRPVNTFLQPGHILRFSAGHQAVAGRSPAR